MTFGLVYLGVFVILIWAFLLSSNLGAGYRYKFWAVSAPASTFQSSLITNGGLCSVLKHRQHFHQVKQGRGGGK